MYSWIVVAVSVCCVAASPLPERRDSWSHWKDQLQHISDHIDHAVQIATRTTLGNSLVAALAGKRELLLGKRNIGTSWGATIEKTAHNAGQAAEMATFTTLMASAMTMAKRDGDYWHGLKDDFMTVAKAVGSAVKATVAKVLHETGVKTSRETDVTPWMVPDNMDDLLEWLMSIYKWQPTESTEIKEWYPKSESTDIHKWHPPETDNTAMIDASSQTEGSH